MFVSLSAALVQACGFGVETREEDRAVATRGDGAGCGGETGQRRGGEDDVFQPKQAINRAEVNSSCQGKDIYIISSSKV